MPMPMAQRRKLKAFLRIFRDRVSLMRAFLSLNRAASSVDVAVLRATASSPSLPSDRRLSSVLRFGHASRITAGFCFGALMDRLHATSDATVALKSLIILNNLISRSSSILHDNLSSSGGRNHLNLSSFRDHTDAETWELSSWVRWYAEFLDQTLIASRNLGYFLVSSDSSYNAGEAKMKKIAGLPNPDLLKEIGVLMRSVEIVANSPESVDLQRNNLIYEVVRLACEDYGVMRGEMILRLVELGDRLDGLTHTELTELLAELDRVEGCKEKLLRLFVNKKNNDRLWDTVSDLRVRALALKERMEEWKLVRKDSRMLDAGATRFQDQDGFAGPYNIIPVAVST